jgi:hypothetical protein
VERVLRQAEALGIWTEETHALFKVLFQARAIMRTVKGEAKVEPEESKIGQAHMEGAQEDSAAQDEAAEESTAAAPSASGAPAAPLSAAPLSAATMAALAAPPPSLEVFAASPHERFPMARTIGEMLTRYHFSISNPLVQALPRGRERDTFVGFSHQTAGRYKRAIRTAEVAGVNLNDFREVNYQDLDTLLAASPEERQRIKAEAQLTKGARLMRRDGQTIAPSGGRIERRSMKVEDEEEGGGGDGRSDDERSEAAASAVGGDPPQPPVLRGGAARFAGGHLLRGEEHLHGPSLGHTPVPIIGEPLQFPAPTPAQISDPNSVYARRKHLAFAACKERDRLLAFVREHHFYQGPNPILPFKGPKDSFGLLHETRKNNAMYLIQTNFRTCPIWTRKFLASTHGNHRRLYIDQQMRKNIAAGAVAHAAAAAATPSGPTTPIKQQPPESEDDDEMKDDAEED